MPPARCQGRLVEVGSRPSHMCPQAPDRRPSGQSTRSSRECQTAAAACHDKERSRKTSIPGIDDPLWLSRVVESAVWPQTSCCSPPAAWRQKSAGFHLSWWPSLPTGARCLAHLCSWHAAQRRRHLDRQTCPWSNCLRLQSSRPVVPYRQHRVRHTGPRPGDRSCQDQQLNRQGELGRKSNDTTKAAMPQRGYQALPSLRACRRVIRLG
jgi:hypothetical protein